MIRTRKENDRAALPERGRGENSARVVSARSRGAAGVGVTDRCGSEGGRREEEEEEGNA